MPKMISSLSLSAALLFSAEAQEPTLPRMELSTDKACYLPGEMVHLTASGTPPSALFIRYRHGAQILAEVPYAEVVKAGRWSWRPPRRDFQGYLVEVYTRSAECELVVATIAIDVSSDWRRFPRYGFVADFDDGGDPAAKRTRIAEEMAFLNRCHINGVQFQDWQWKHHYPAPLDAKGQLMPAYRDVSNRWVKAEHVRHYIELQHRYGMKSIFYNLCFGSWKGATEDGVQEARAGRVISTSWIQGTQIGSAISATAMTRSIGSLTSMAIRSTSSAVVVHAMMRRGARSISHAPMPPSSRPSRSVAPRSVSS